jgi:integrase
MGHIVKTPAGTFRANWRNAAGRQKAKTFKTRKEAAAFLAETEANLTRGTYVDPHAGRLRFGEYAKRWAAARTVEKTTRARDASILANHVIPRWGSVPIGKIDHLAVQAWVTDLSEQLSAATVAKCFQLFALVLRAAMRDRLIGVNPADGVRLPAPRKKDTDERTIAPEVLIHRLLPVVPPRYRALVALAGGTGMRWGECVGLRWDAVDLMAGTARIVRVAVEVAGTVTTKPFPKSKAGRRGVPLPPLVVDLLNAHRTAYPPGPSGEIFTNQAGGPPRRSLFRSRVWRPALVRAGLLGGVAETGLDKWQVRWRDNEGLEWLAEFATEREAVAHVAKKATGGMRFHDLRHSYATHLVTKGVPITDIQAVMGHERPSTTLNLYTHKWMTGRDTRVQGALDAFSLTDGATNDGQ